MEEYEEHFSAWYFDLNRAYIDEPTITTTEIRVPIKDFGILKGYLGVEEYTFYSSGVFVYENVTQSKRIISEYLTEDKQEFGREYEIIDGPFLPSDKPMFLHQLIAVSEKMNAWISWKIIATSVRVEDAKTQK